MIYFIFGENRIFLGELQMRDGAFGCVLLSHEGEKQLGTHFTTWQVRGVPVTEDTHIKLRDQSFQRAVCAWLNTQGFRCEELAPEQVAPRYAVMAMPQTPIQRKPRQLTKRKK